jgi:peroxiredoxin
MKIVLGLASCISVLVYLQSDSLSQIAKKAPAFVLEDVDGNSVSLADFQNRIVVLDFWATWCHECEYTSPELEKIYRKYKDNGLILLGISLDEGGDATKKVKAFAEKFQLSFKMLMGHKKIAKAYTIRGIPATFILDRNHIIVARYDGSGFEEEITSEVEKLL